MAVENKNRGAVKASEVSTDRPITALGVTSQEDFLTIAERLKDLGADTQKKASAIISSTGAITWNYPQIRIPVGVKLVIRQLITTSDRASTVTDFTITGVPNGIFPSTSSETPNASYTIIDLSCDSGQSSGLFIESGRNDVNSTPGDEIVVSLNESSTGPRLAKRTWDSSGVMGESPIKAESGASGDNHNSSMSIPVALVYNDGATPALFWARGGMLWPSGTASRIGQVSTDVEAPIGSIMAWHRPDGLTDGGVDQSLVTSLCGDTWKLCDGTAISDPASPLNGYVVPNLVENEAVGTNRSSVVSVAYTPSQFNASYFGLTTTNCIAIFLSNPTSAKSMALQNAAGGTVSPDTIPWPRISIGGMITGPNLQTGTKVLDYLVADSLFASETYNTNATFRAVVLIKLDRDATAPVNVAGNTYRIQNPTYLVGAPTSPNNSTSIGENTQSAGQYPATHTHVFTTDDEYQPNGYSIAYQDNNRPLRNVGSPGGSGGWSIYSTLVNSGAYVPHSFTSYYSGYNLPHQNRPASFDVIYIMRIK